VRPALGAGLLAAAVGCSSSFPGSQVMGTFHFVAQPALLPDGGWDMNCPYDAPGDGLPDGGSFAFDGTFSWNPSTRQTWFTYLGGTWDAGFDGQTILASGAAARSFAKCCVPVQLVETMTVALLSQSQSAAVGETCPDHPLDGGVPSPGDGGITLPSQTPAGFDALLACGTLTDDVAVGLNAQACDAGSVCVACTWRYTLTGVRR